MAGRGHELDKNQIGERIRLLREERHLSRDDLAKLLNISPRHLGGVETGNKGMSMELFYDLTKVLNASADYILNGKGPEGDDVRRTRIKENIISYLSACTTPALEHMEDITRSYVTSHVDRGAKNKDPGM